MTTVEHSIDLSTSPAAARRALAAAAADWGAEVEPIEAPGRPEDCAGRLLLPVVAGLRRGLLAGPVTVEESGAGARLTFRPERQDYVVETSVVAMLLVAAAGGILGVAWPLVPRLLPVAPLGVVLALSGWFLLASRQRGRGPRDFLEAVAAHAAAEPAAAEPPASG
jgi:hypothetical protein